MTWISTLSGRKIDFLNPDPRQIEIEDIAAGLAAASRFVGQTVRDGAWIPYCVAEHSFLASCRCERFPLEALLHDAAEGYMGVCNRPLKDLLRPLWDPIERRIHAAICRRFGVRDDMPPEVKAVDDRLLMTERRDLQPRSPEWDSGNDYTRAVPYDHVIHPRSQEHARRLFLERFGELRGNR